ncbi:MAG: hypothetical protein Q8S09_09325 [Hyphomonas sp.]|nr:hypothetical protein [Hyphomonas sp.]
MCTIFTIGLSALILYCFIQQPQELFGHGFVYHALVHLPEALADSLIA